MIRRKFTGIAGFGLMLVGCETPKQTTTTTASGSNTVQATTTPTPRPASSPKKNWLPQGARQTGSHLP
ncbi:MAG: hypothetical protein ABR589_07695 [Chthoniobacterales bacterium]